MLVAVVQAHDLAREDDQRNRRDHEEAQPVLSEHAYSQGDRQRSRENVGRNKKPSLERVAVESASRKGFLENGAPAIGGATLRLANGSRSVRQWTAMCIWHTAPRLASAGPPP